MLFYLNFFLSIIFYSFFQKHSELRDVGEPWPTPLSV